MSYYNGNDSESSFDRECPLLDQPGKEMFYVGVGSAVGQNRKRTCGILHQYLVPANNEQDAVQRLRSYFEMMIEDVRRNTTDQDKEETLWITHKDAFDLETRQAREIDAKIESLREEIDDLNEIEDAMRDAMRAVAGLPSKAEQIQERIDDLIARRVKLMEPEQENKSRFGMIIEPVRKNIAWIDAGNYVVDPMPTRRPIPVSYLDDWRGETQYITIR